LLIKIIEGAGLFEFRQFTKNSNQDPPTHKDKECNGMNKEFCVTEILAESHSVMMTFSSQPRPPDSLGDYEVYGRTAVFYEVYGRTDILPHSSFFQLAI